MDKECCCDDSCCSVLQIGKPAPDFKMEGYFKGKVKNYHLDDFKGKWVVLFFYPLDFTFVCPTELLELSKKHKDFEEIDAQVLGVSVDSVYSHEAWLKDLGDLEYPLLSDITKQVSDDYNVLIHEKGISLRGAFIIDPEGDLKSYTVNDVTIGRNIDELVRLIKAFKTGDLCPVGWQPGKETLGKA